MNKIRCVCGKIILLVKAEEKDVVVCRGCGKEHLIEEKIFRQSDSVESSTENTGDVCQETPTPYKRINRYEDLAYRQKTMRLRGMIMCGKCGKQHSTGAVLCTRCGHYFVDENLFARQKFIKSTVDFMGRFFHMLMGDVAFTFKFIGRLTLLLLLLMIVMFTGLKFIFFMCQTVHSVREKVIAARQNGNSAMMESKLEDNGGDVPVSDEDWVEENENLSAGAFGKLDGKTDRRRRRFRVTNRMKTIDEVSGDTYDDMIDTIETQNMSSMKMKFKLNQMLKKSQDRDGRKVDSPR